MTKVNESEIKKDQVGIFFEADTLENAITELKSIGIDYEQLGLLSEESSLKGKLGHIYEKIANASDGNSPDTVFVDEESVGSAPYAAIGGLSFVATALGGGAILASAGVLGGALAVATATPVVIGLAGLLAGYVLNQSDANALQEQVEAGHLLLFVRTSENRLKEQVAKVLEKHAGTKAIEITKDQ